MSSDTQRDLTKDRYPRRGRRRRRLPIPPQKEKPVEVEQDYFAGLQVAMQGRRQILVFRTNSLDEFKRIEMGYYLRVRELVKCPLRVERVIQKGIRKNPQLPLELRTPVDWIVDTRSGAVRLCCPVRERVIERVQEGDGLGMFATGVLLGGILF